MSSHTPSNTSPSISSNQPLSLIKRKVIQQINVLDTDAKLLKLSKYIDKLDEEEEEEKQDSSFDEYSQLIDEVLSAYHEKDEPMYIRHNMLEVSRLQRFENRLAPIMCWFSILMLGLMGFIIMFSFSVKARHLITSGILWDITMLYFVLMSVPFLELVYILYLVRKEQIRVSYKQLIFRAVAIPLVPLRMGARRLSDPEWLWIPFWHWSKCNDVLLEELKRKFSLPMIGIALLIVPILLIGMNEKINTQVAARVPEIDLYLELAQAFIWVAFTFEFILMFSVTKYKLDYCKANWIDLFIILLPLVSFLRSFRALQGIARVNQLARAYRFKGVIMKVREAFMLAEVIQRLLFPNPEAQLRSLQKKIQRHRREKIQIQKQVEMAVERIKKSRESKKKRGRLK